MTSKATARQVQILCAIRDLTALRGFPPTLQELSRHLGMKAPGGAASGVKSLINKGSITAAPRTARSLRLTDAGIQSIQLYESSSP